jgi:hypothetical protein
MAPQSPTRDAWLAWDVQISFVGGGYSEHVSGNHGLGLMFGGMVTFRSGPFEIGGLLQLDEAALKEGALTAALVGGLAVQLGETRGSGVRLEILAELGVDGLDENVGLGPTGASGSVGVLGLRFGASYRIRPVGDGVVSTGFGLWVTAEHDGSMNSGYMSCDISGCQQLSGPVGGGTRVGILLGGFFDIGPR